MTLPSSASERYRVQANARPYVEHQVIWFDEDFDQIGNFRLVGPGIKFYDTAILRSVPDIIVMIGDEEGAIALDGPVRDMERINETQDSGFLACEPAEQA